MSVLRWLALGFLAGSLTSLLVIRLFPTRLTLLIAIGIFNAWGIVVRSTDAAYAHAHPWATSSLAAIIHGIVFIWLQALTGLLPRRVFRNSRTVQGVVVYAIYLILMLWAFPIQDDL